MLPVSAAFHAAESDDVAQLASQVYLVLGDYANANSHGAIAGSSGSDASGNYPALGAINGDRTELNIGTAASADNGIGKSSWRSSDTPDSGAFTYLEIDFGATRTFNRVKLYHLSTNPISSYVLEYWDGSQWIAFAATSDIVVPDGSGGYAWGYGDGPYGDTPYGGAYLNGSPTQITTSRTLDIVDTPDFTGSKLRLVVNRTYIANDKANVVALEVYRKVDVTDRCTQIDISRQRDYKLLNPMAAGCSLTFDNADRYFSVYYTPTAAQAAAGFVNAEIDAGIGIIVKEGFITANGTELATIFVGTLDEVKADSKTGRATMTCRDGIKDVINQVVSTKLKTSQDIGTSVVYLLNLANISTYETSVDTTTISLDYFFTYETSILTTVQQLVQACGDAQFYFNESGTATFRMYLNNVPQIRTISSKAEWDGGTVLTSVDTAAVTNAIRGPWKLLDDFTDNEFTSNPVWTQEAQAVSGSANAGSGYLRLGCPSSGSVIGLDTPFTQATGTYRWRARLLSGLSTPVNSGSNDGAVVMFMQTQASYLSAGNVFLKGYGLRFNLRNNSNAPDIQLMRYDDMGPQNGTVLLSLGSSFFVADTFVTWTVIRDSSGLMVVYANGVAQGSVTDNTYTSCAKFGVANSTFGINAFLNIDFDDIYYTPFFADQPAIYESAVIDQGATILSEGIFQATYLQPTGTTIAFYTATSTDGISFDPYVAATPGAVIASTTRRYIKFKITFTVTLSYTSLDTPTVFDVSLNWSTGAGSSKYHTSNDFLLRYDDQINELELNVSDDLGGDTSIINDVNVKASPLILSGTTSDTQWQGTTGTPKAAIAVANPLTVSVGTVTYPIDIPGGMDTAFMSGANPAAAVVTFGTAVGTWAFSFIHPTKPVLVLTITTGGTITDLRVVGKSFANDTTGIEATAQDAASIALHRKRTQKISNNYIISQPLAQSIADRIVDTFATSTNWLEKLEILPAYSMQLGDRANVVDDNLALDHDFNVVGLAHTLQVAQGSVSAVTTAKAIAIP